MAGDPNRDRDRALRDIAGYLKSIDGRLRKLVRLQELRSGVTTPTEYFNRGDDDDSTDPANGEEHVGPYGTGPAPYA
jgi:hypothetical protein